MCDDHSIQYTGRNAATWCIEDNALIGFAGDETTGITVDGVEYRFTDAPNNFVWSRIEGKWLTPRIKRLELVMMESTGVLRVPMSKSPQYVASCPYGLIFETQKAVPYKMENGWLEIDIGESLAGKYIAMYDEF